MKTIDLRVDNHKTFTYYVCFYFIEMYRKRIWLVICYVWPYKNKPFSYKSKDIWFLVDLNEKEVP